MRLIAVSDSFSRPFVKTFLDIFLNFQSRLWIENERLSLRNCIINSLYVFFVLYPGFNTKQNLMVRLQSSSFGGIWSIPSFSLLPGPHLLKAEGTVTFLSMSQMELFSLYYV